MRSTSRIGFGTGGQRAPNHRVATQLAVAWMALAFGWPTPSSAASGADLQQQVADTERAFARTMAERDQAAFTSFLADEAIFFAGDAPLRGKAAVVAGWAPFFEGPDAPFSWEPEQVEVLESGALALSTGPVRDPAGNVIARFQSVWRREASGQWRIVFDRGTPACPMPAPG